MLSRLTLLFCLTLPSAVWGQDLPSTVDEFREKARAYMATRIYSILPAPKVGKVLYVPVQNEVAGQPYWSLKRMNNQLEDIYKENGADLTPYDEGRSAYPKSEAHGGIFYRGNVHIYDRHHHSLANIYVGGETMPVRIMADWSHLSPSKFEERMLKRGLIFPWAIDGSRLIIPALIELIENPFLYLPKLFMLKIKTKLRNAKRKILSVKGANPALVIKIDDGTPYLELKAVAPLHKRNFILPDLDQPLSEEKLREISDILNEAPRDSQSLDTEIFETPTRAEDLKLQKLVDGYYSNARACRKALFGR